MMNSDKKTEQIQFSIQQTINKHIAELEKIKPEHEEKNKVSLPAHGSWPAAYHQFDRDSINAVKTALAARRPLLLRGDPGTGKSQLARAVAVALGRLFVYEVVNAHTESQDLLWRFDAVGQLAEAQSLVPGAFEAERQQLLDSRRYTCPGPLWWVLNWETANKIYSDSRYQLARPEQPEGWKADHGSVLLIDEIDKANPELPNGLLELLGNNSISIPWLDEAVIGGSDCLPQLVIITTNEERELPAAFVRRCLVLNLSLPDYEDGFKQTLVERGRLHFSEHCCNDVCLEAAEQLWTDREAARTRGLIHLPGQAEYLDLLRALSVLGKNADQQKKLLKDISGFTFQKYPVKHGR